MPIQIVGAAAILGAAVLLQRAAHPAAADESAPEIAADERSTVVPGGP